MKNKFKFLTVILTLLILMISCSEDSDKDKTIPDQFDIIFEKKYDISNENHIIQWNGLDKNGNLVEDGRYSIILDVTLENGQVISDTFEIEVIKEKN